MTETETKVSKRVLKPKKKFELPWKEIAIFVTGMLIGVLL